MDTKRLNQLPIRQYLADNKITPVKDKGHYGMYHSPFRADHNASMKVDYNKNLWIDYGTGEGGTIIDLIMRLEACTFSEAIRRLEQTLSGMPPFSFHGNNLVPKEENSVMIINKVQPITNPILIIYLNERRINLGVARQQCKEICYSVNGKPYFALGFPNNSGGYELRNRYFKGCTSKDITGIVVGSNACLVFEGFMDALSFLTMKRINQFRQNVVVLNSVANLPKAETYLRSQEKVYTFLDNDEAGRQATEKLKTVCQSLSDQSGLYAKYKDLNAYLCSEFFNQKKHQSKGLKR